MAMNEDGRWVIENQLLHDLLTYGNGSERVTGLKACWSGGHDFHIVKGIVAWLTMRALKIERLPWMADWPFSLIRDHQALEQAVNYLRNNPIEVDAACKELCKIHAHTQSFYSKQTSLSLGRGYKNDPESSLRFGDYATIVKRHALAAQLIGQPNIVVPQDVITSWGHDWKYTGCVVGVYANIPTSDILCSAETLAPRQGEIGQNALEQGEFLVLNRSWDGLANFPANSVKSINGFNVEEPKTPKEAQAWLSEAIPTMRPNLNHLANHARLHPAPQSLKSRLRRAYDILRAKRQ